jgi:glucose-1-phosphate cytidylyltransferase
MKAVIFAGGYGSRISEESGVRPKPMVEIGNRPILWHILKIYSHFGINDFIICCGYKSYVIKEYFSNYFLRSADVTFDMCTNKMQIHNASSEPWKITLVETGENTMTGGRLKRVKDYIGDETFCLTYGDGLSDINISNLIAFHKLQGLQATLTAVQQPGRFGAFNLGHEDVKINQFQEKPLNGETPWINGGFFVCEPSVLDLIKNDDTIWERGPLEILARTGNLAAFKHSGFWQPMDTLRDKHLLEELWENGKAPWRVWTDSKQRELTAEVQTNTLSYA